MMLKVIDKLFEESNLDRQEFLYILENLDEASRKILRSRAREVRETYYGREVYLRGLIEYSNCCSKNCLYCGIRKDNEQVNRYVMSRSDILDRASNAHKLGFKTLVIQGGQGGACGVSAMSSTVSQIKSRYPEMAVTLSLGEMTYEDYRCLYRAGADRYLLRHETASERLYRQLHPDGSLENRKKCLYNLKEIGFEVGSGFLVGLPGQTLYDLVEDLVYLKKLNPHMIGIGPFIPHAQTPLRDGRSGELELVLDLMSMVRLSHPKALIPSTTALATIDIEGREKGLLAGANVLMPNLGSPRYKSDYLLYDGKVCLDEKLDDCMACLSSRVLKLGYTINMSRGDSYGWERLRDRR